MRTVTKQAVGVTSLLLLLVALSCQPESGNRPVPVDVPALDLYEEVQGYNWGQEDLPEYCRTGLNRILHVAPWPGLGVGIVVGVRNEQGEPVAAVDPAWFELRTLDDKVVSHEMSSTQVDREYLLVLLADPTGLAEDAGQVSALSAFLEQLPAGVDVALYRRCGIVEQVDGFGFDRTALLARLEHGLPPCPDEEPLDYWDALSGAADELEQIGGGSFPAIRSLIVLGDALPDAPADFHIGGQPQTVYAVHGGETPLEMPYSVRTVALGDGGLAEALDLVTVSIALEHEGLYSLGACPGLEPKTTILLAADEGGACPLLTPKGPLEEAAAACDAGATADGLRVFPTTVRLSFTDDQRTIFDQYVEKKNKTDFDLSIALGDGEPVEATAHLRGQTSLDCVRKSYTVNLKGGKGRHLLPGSATDEFYLITMCKDDRYFQQYTANILARELGLFPLQWGLVELFVESDTAGVYLLLEKRKEALLEDHSRMKTILRRRFDPGEKPPDVEYPAGLSADNPLVDAYFELTSALESLSGENLVVELEARLDLDQFLRLLAFMTLTGNGDYVDELIFYSLEAVRAEGAVEWFKVMAWDMDDLFSSCHHSGKHAMDDPYKLLFCAEGNLEKAIMFDPLVYDRFVVHLEELMTRVTADRLDEAVNETAAVLLPYFERPEICEVMAVLLKSNPEAVEPEVAQTDILEKMDKLRDQYAVRRAKLEARIETYHADMEAR